MLALDQHRALDARPALASWLGTDAHWKLVWMAAWAAAVVPAGLAWAGAGRVHPVLDAVVVPALVWASIAGLIVLVAWRERVRRWAFGRGVKRALARVPAVDGEALAKAGEDAPVRVRGRVRAFEGLDGQPSVAVRREALWRRGARRREVRERAVKFRLVDERGREIDVDVAHAVLLEGAGGALSWQLRIGDTVEVVGFKHTHADASGTGPYRATQARYEMRAQKDRPVLVRPA